MREINGGAFAKTHLAACFSLINSTWRANNGKNIFTDKNDVLRQQPTITKTICINIGQPSIKQSVLVNRRLALKQKWRLLLEKTPFFTACKSTVLSHHFKMPVIAGIVGYVNEYVSTSY